MPDKQLTIATYAAGASLAAITLVYVFAPTFFLDGDSTGGTSSRKKTIVGLHNPANDCFINSVLQALAGLGDLRIYLIRETHRRKMDGPEVYQTLVPNPARKDMPPWKIEGLQNGVVTQGLKDILNALNERPLYKKTISASSFVQVMEAAFKQRISRQQQDAQEFLQIVAERLCDEYHAGHRARDHARKAQNVLNGADADTEPIETPSQELPSEEAETIQTKPTLAEEEHPAPNGNVEVEVLITDSDGKTVIVKPDIEEGFPLEGGSESQIECLTCGFKPKPSTTTFCSLTLSVPQVSSTTLSSCFDQMFKTEFIEDFKCDKCRLVHALGLFQEELSKSNSEKFKAKAQKSVELLEKAIETDPEEELKDVEMPDRKFAPKRKIAKHVRITRFPKVMAIHLSRSIFDAGRSTMKNSAKVSFPERLPLGGLLTQKFYRLSSVVCHKGSHHSGHYESFRRQTITAPFSTPNTFQPAPVYSMTPSPIPSQASTPQVGAVQRSEQVSTEVSTLNSTPEVASPVSASSSSPSLPYTSGRQSGDSPPSTSTSASMPTTATTKGPTSAPKDKDTEASSIRSMARSAKSTLTKVPSIRGKKTEDDGTATSPGRTSLKGPRKRQISNRWWRISDDKIKESKTSEVLGMQKEVYLLFYELEKDE